jgi:cupin 2 domain-containing protein
MIKLENISAKVPEKLPKELVEILASAPNFRIERAVSPKSDIPSKVYDQKEDEFVMVVNGYAQVELISERRTVEMNKGDYMIIPAHLRHRLIKTRKNTIWLAAFYKK